MKRRSKILLVILILLIPVGWLGWKLAQDVNPNPKFEIGQALDSLDGVKVFYNGMVGHSGKRNVSPDGYNIGIPYQCVEFVKRYYYEHYHHKMPDAYGNAKDFFDASVKDGGLNTRRALLQFTNPSASKPQRGDLLIFDGHVSNVYGHVAIISNVNETNVEIIQQNPGPFAPSRVTFPLEKNENGYTIKQDRTLGWLRMK
jgi:surface antigen